MHANRRVFRAESLSDRWVTAALARIDHVVVQDRGDHKYMQGNAYPGDYCLGASRRQRMLLATTVAAQIAEAGWDDARSGVNDADNGIAAMPKAASRARALERLRRQLCSTLCGPVPPLLSMALERHRRCLWILKHTPKPPSGRPGHPRPPPGAALLGRPTPGAAYDSGTTLGGWRRSVSVGTGYRDDPFGGAASSSPKDDFALRERWKGAMSAAHCGIGIIVGRGIARAAPAARGARLSLPSKRPPAAIGVLRLEDDELRRIDADAAAKLGAFAEVYRAGGGLDATACSSPLLLFWHHALECGNAASFAAMLAQLIAVVHPRAVVSVEGKRRRPPPSRVGDKSVKGKKRWPMPPSTPPPDLVGEDQQAGSRGGAEEESASTFRRRLGGLWSAEKLAACADAAIVAAGAAATAAATSAGAVQHCCPPRAVVLPTLRALCELAVVTGSFAVVLRLIQCLTQLHSSTCPFVEEPSLLAPYAAFRGRMDEARELCSKRGPLPLSPPRSRAVDESSAAFLEASYVLELKSEIDLAAQDDEEEGEPALGSATDDAAASGSGAASAGVASQRRSDSPPPPGASARGLTWSELAPDVSARWVVAAQNLAPVLMESVPLCYIALLHSDDDVNDAFHWLQRDGASYRGMLPSEPLPDRKGAAAARKPRNAQREAVARSLQEFTGMESLPLCVKALEENNDEMELAANWIFEHGHEIVTSGELEALESEYYGAAEEESSDEGSSPSSSPAAAAVAAPAAALPDPDPPSSPVPAPEEAVKPEEPMPASWLEMALDIALRSLRSTSVSPAPATSAQADAPFGAEMQHVVDREGSTRPADAWRIAHTVLCTLSRGSVINAADDSFSSADTGKSAVAFVPPTWDTDASSLEPMRTRVAVAVVDLLSASFHRIRAASRGQSKSAFSASFLPSQSKSERQESSHLRDTLLGFACDLSAPKKLRAHALEALGKGIGYVFCDGAREHVSLIKKCFQGCKSLVNAMERDRTIRGMLAEVVAGVSPLLQTFALPGKMDLFCSSERTVRVLKSIFISQSSVARWEMRRHLDTAWRGWESLRVARLLATRLPMSIIGDHVWEYLSRDEIKSCDDVAVQLPVWEVRVDQFGNRFWRSVGDDRLCWTDPLADPEANPMTLEEIQKQKVVEIIRDGAMRWYRPDTGKVLVNSPSEIFHIEGAVPFWERATQTTSLVGLVGFKLLQMKSRGGCMHPKRLEYDAQLAMVILRSSTSLINEMAVALERKDGKARSQAVERAAIGFLQRSIVFTALPAVLADLSGCAASAAVSAMFCEDVASLAVAMARLNAQISLVQRCHMRMRQRENGLCNAAYVRLKRVEQDHRESIDCVSARGRDTVSPTSNFDALRAALLTEADSIQHDSENEALFNVETLLTMEGSASSVFGRMVATLVEGPVVSELEGDLSRWLDSPLFSSGTVDSKSPFSSSTVDRAEFAAGLSYEAGDDTGGAAVLLNWLESKAPESKIRRKRGVFPKIERMYIAMLTVHCGIWRQAEGALEFLRQEGSSPADLEPTPQLLFAWSQILEVRKWLRGQALAFRQGTAFEELIAQERRLQDLIDSGALLEAELSASATSPPPSTRSPFGRSASSPGAAASKVASPNPMFTEHGGGEDGAAPDGRLPSSVLRQLRRRQHRRLPIPATFEDLKLGMNDALDFILDFVPERDAYEYSTGAESAPEPAQGEEDSPRRRKLFEQMKRVAREAFFFTTTGRIACATELISETLETRNLRAKSRSDGLEIMGIYIKSLLIESSRTVPVMHPSDQFSSNVLLPHGVALEQSLLPLRRALRGRVVIPVSERRRDTNRELGSDMASVVSLHHYSRHLSGCTRRLAKNVKSAFYSCYRSLQVVLVACANHLPSARKWSALTRFHERAATLETRCESLSAAAQAQMGLEAWTHQRAMMVPKIIAVHSRLEHHLESAMVKVEENGTTSRYARPLPRYCEPDIVAVARATMWCWAVDWKSEDHSFLTECNIVHTLHRLSSVATRVNSQKSSPAIALDQVYELSELVAVVSQIPTAAGQGLSSAPELSTIAGEGKTDSSSSSEGTGWELHAPDYIAMSPFWALPARRLLLLLLCPEEYGSDWWRSWELEEARAECAASLGKIQKKKLKKKKKKMMKKKTRTAINKYARIMGLYEEILTDDKLFAKMTKGRKFVAAMARLSGDDGESGQLMMRCYRSFWYAIVAGRRATLGATSATNHHGTDATNDVSSSPCSRLDIQLRACMPDSVGAGSSLELERSAWALSEYIMMTVVHAPEQGPSVRAERHWSDDHKSKRDLEENGNGFKIKFDTLNVLATDLRLAAENLARWSSFVHKRIHGGLFSNLKMDNARIEERYEATVEDIERSAFERLRALAALLDGTFCQQFFVESTHVLRTVIHLTSIGSPRIQRIAFRLLRRIVPFVPPARFSEIAAEGVDGAGELAARSAFVLYVLRRAGQENCALLAKSSAADTDWYARLGPHGFSHGYGAGHGFLASAAEAVMLLRAMLSKKSSGNEWAELTHTVMENAIIAGVDRFRSDGAVLDGAVAACSGALSVLGSHTPMLRVGAVAEIASRAGSSMEREGSLVTRLLLGGQSRGIVVAYARGYSKALVLFGTDTIPSTVAVEEVRVVDEIMPPAASMSLAPRVLRAIFSIAALTNEESTARDHVNLQQQGANVVDAAGSQNTHPLLLIAAMRACAYRALPHILANEDSAIAAAEIGIIDALVTCALQPGELQSFVATSYLEERAMILYERIYELDHYSTKAIPSDAALPNAQGGGSAGVSSAPSVEQTRLEAAQKLSTVLGKDVSLCLKALQLNAEDRDDAAEWIMVHGEAFVAGGGMDGGGVSSDSTATSDVDSSTWQVAKQLGVAAGQPPMLCYRALELCHNDSNLAMGWLLDQGDGYRLTMPSGADDLEESRFFASPRSRAPPGAGSPGMSSARTKLLTADEALIDHVGPLGGLNSDEGWDARQSEERARRRDSASAGSITREATSYPLEFGCAARHIAFGGARGRAEFVFGAIETGGGVQHMLSSLRPGTLLTWTRLIGPAPRVVGRFTGHIAWNGVKSSAESGVGGLPSFDVRVLSQRSGLSRLYNISDAAQCRLHAQVGGASSDAEPRDALPRIAVGVYTALVTRAAREALVAMNGRALVHWATANVRDERARAEADIDAEAPAAERGAAEVEKPAEGAAESDISTSAAFSRIIGGPKKLLQLLKLVASSEHAFANAFAGEEGAGSSEGDGLQPRVRLTPLLQARVEALLVEQQAPLLLEHGVSFREIIVRESTSHLMQSTQPGDASEHKVVESLHPYFPCCEYSGEVHFEGAKALRIELDSRCSLSQEFIEFRGDNVPVARLDFFEQLGNSSSSGDVDDGATNGQRVKSFIGRTFTPSTFVVHGSCVRYNFFARHAHHRNPRHGRDRSPERYGWGFRFRVSPIRGLQWLRENQVLGEPSLVWACWLMGFMLRQSASQSAVALSQTAAAPGADEIVDALDVKEEEEEEEVAWTLPVETATVSLLNDVDDASALPPMAAVLSATVEGGASSALHNKKVVDALLRYLYSKDAPFKHRVVILLTQLLTAPHLFVNGPSSKLPTYRPFIMLRRLVEVSFFIVSYH